MKLITDELKKRFEEVGDQHDVEDPIIITRFFDPGGTIRWYVVEYYPDNNTCYAYFTGMP
ncbi:hypothetical protein [Kordia sp.]|uniref:hypothetical protein n=1 Tax=Kordia sp. TaxID=1965332 RepID=UPI003D2921DF